MNHAALRKHIQKLVQSGLMLALCLLLPCIALGETTAEVPAAKETAAETPVAAETAVEAALPTAYDVRYYFEQMLLPQR